MQRNSACMSAAGTRKSLVEYRMLALVPARFVAEDSSMSLARCLSKRNRRLHLIALIIVGGPTAFPTPSRGGPILTGLVQHGVQPGENGQTAGSPIYNTLGNESSFANIYLVQANAGPNGPFLNSGNGDAARIAVSLTPGTYQFYFFAYNFHDPTGYFGLNLFFDGDDTHPGISAWSPTNTVTANAAGAGLTTIALNGTTTLTPASGSLTYIDGSTSVTLTGYGFGLPGVFGGGTFDRIGNLNNQPDLDPDGVGVFTLNVATVPEPSSLVLWLGAVAGIVTLPRSRAMRKEKS